MPSPILLVGSRNPHKLREIEALLQGLPLQVHGAEILPPLEVEESGETFEENARLKALAFARAAAGLPLKDRPSWVLSDDSGLCVDALGGAPGVRSARYAGEGHCDEANNRKLLLALRAVPPPARTARFVCAAACAALPEAGGEPQVVIEARGECPGMVGSSPRGGGGFGYDPLFFLPELGRTYAELTEEEKNRLSHRGKAFRALRQRLQALLAAAGAR